MTKIHLLMKYLIKMNDHPFILGINANLGMILAFIPDIILKCSIKKKILKDEK